MWYGYWEGTNPNTVLDNYATVSLFLQWLRIHASNGTEIYKEILASEDRDVDAVTAAAETRSILPFPIGIPSSNLVSCQLPLPPDGILWV